jgi:glutaredoxin
MAVFRVFLTFTALGMGLASSTLVQESQPVGTNVGKRCLQLRIYTRSDSELCKQAVSYAESLVERRGGICLQVIDLEQDSAALAEYWQLMQKFAVKKPAVPTFQACGRVKVGFHNDSKSKADVDELFAVHAYIRSTCQHCRDAKRFLTDLAARWKGIRVNFHDVDREESAMQSMNELARRNGITAPALPVISVCGQLISGYRSDATTGRQIEQLLLKASLSTAVMTASGEPLHAPKSDLPLNRLAAFAIQGEPFQILNEARYAQAAPPASDKAPRRQESKKSSQGVEVLPPTGDDEQPAEETYAIPMQPPEGIDLPWFGFVRVRDFGLVAFTLLIGLVDGFNPCAMWVLVFLLSVLVNVKDRRKIAAIAGTFVVVSGLAYFTFMAAWLNLFLLIGIARPLQIALGLLAIVIGAINIKDFVAFKQGVTLSIPESTKPGIYDRVRRIVTAKYISVAIGLSVILAVLVNIVEILCTAGLPALYTQILTVQQLPSWQNYVYLAIYNLAYMFDDTLMVSVFVITLSHRKMRETEGRWLKLVSGCVVLALGLIILFRPNWLQW